MWWLVGRLIMAARAAATSRGLALVGGGLAAADFLNLDWLMAQGIKIAPGSDQAAITEAAHTAARLLGLGGDEILWPVHGPRHAQAGEPIVPRYLVVDLNRGRAWYTERYFSRKSVMRSRGFGQRRGFSRGMNQGLRQTQAYARG